LAYRKNRKVRKKLGQHFLKDCRIIDQILSAASIQADDVVVEIGPGTGSLTFSSC
jgi:16S rRNA (adenine1518-N6/adenine1519-N6)-dimethyltransferase